MNDSREFEWGKDKLDETTVRSSLDDPSLKAREMLISGIISSAQAISPGGYHFDRNRAEFSPPRRFFRVVTF